VHDRQFIQRITALPTITPLSIRRVARDLAADGMAGEEAMEAALKTIDASRDELVVANYTLLMALIDQVDAMLPTVPHETVQDMEQRAQRTVVRIAPRIGKSPDWVAGSLESLAQILCNVGIRSQTTQTRVRRMLGVLRDVRVEIAAWRSGNEDDTLASYADMISKVADVTLSLATTLLDQAYALTDDTVGLLRTWSTEQASVIQAAVRPEWLLDGWDQICLLWRQARHPAEQRAALVEIAQLVPAVPREAMDWAGVTVDSEKLMSLHRFVPLNEDWRTGAIVFELIARNEHLRALGT
jgi:hypothetical protein